MRWPVRSAAGSTDRTAASVRPAVRSSPVHAVVARVDREGERDHLGGADPGGAVRVDRPEPGGAGYVAEAGEVGARSAESA